MNRVCLSCSVQVEGAAWRTATRIMTGVGGPRWPHRSGTRWPDDREVGWYYVRSAPCTRRRGVQISWLSLKTKVDSLSVVWSQNHRDGLLRFSIKTGGDGFHWFVFRTSGFGFSRFGLKTGGGGFPDFDLKIGIYGLVIWASKSPWWFLDLCLKIKWMMVCRLRLKTVGGWVGAGHTSRSSGLRCVEARQTRVSQSDLKTSGGAMRIVHVTSSRWLRRCQVEDGRVDATDCFELCYSYFAVFIVLGRRVILVF
jgi:hypothetical protein